MNENLLPKSILLKAFVSGKEYGWRKGDIPEAIKAATDVNLAVIGGQPQFIVDGYTCEPYWLGYDSDSRRIDETWAEYVQRSGREVLTRFQKLIDETDFEIVVENWEFLKQKRQEGKNLMECLFFILYFDSEPKVA